MNLISIFHMHDVCNVSDDDVDRAMQFASVKIGGTPGEPFHKNQKLKWDHKVN